MGQELRKCNFDQANSDFNKEFSPNVLGQVIPIFAIKLWEAEELIRL